MSYENRVLLNLARKLPCCAEFKHDCTSRFPNEHDQYYTVPAHANGLMWGHGAGLKAPDCFFAAVCPTAHDFIDGRRGGWAKDIKRDEWLRAYIKTQEALWERGMLRVA